MRDDERHSADDWTTLEKSRLDSLPRARTPSDLLKTRTVVELRQRGLVTHRASASVSRAALIVVAASLVFVAGGVVGYRLALTRVEAQARLATVAPESEPDARSANAEHVVWF